MEENEIILSTIVDKINQLGESVARLPSELGKIIPKESPDVEVATRSDIEQLRQVLQNNEDCQQSIRELKATTNRLEPLIRVHYQLMKNPPESRAHHVHHFKWPLGVAIGLLVLLIAAGCWIFLDQQKIRGYIANDTKYRFLKVNSTGKLETYLYDIDSLYENNSQMRSMVLQQQRDEQERIELLQEARAKEEAAKELRQKAKSGNSPKGQQ